MARLISMKNPSLGDEILIQLGRGGNTKIKWKPTQMEMIETLSHGKLLLLLPAIHKVLILK